MSPRPITGWSALTDTTGEVKDVIQPFGVTYLKHFLYFRKIIIIYTALTLYPSCCIVTIIF